MVIRNSIPSEALVFETVIVVLMGSFALLTLRKFYQKRRISTFYLFLTNLSYMAAVISSATGKYIDFFSSSTHDYSGYTIIFAYCFVGFGNIFIYAFVESVFLSDNVARKYFFATCYGLLIGVFLTMNSTEEGAYDRLFGIVIILILLSLVTYLALIYYSFREFRNAQSRVPRVGFLFIAIFGIFLISIFVSFAIDIAIITIRGHGYSIGYYMGWSSGVLAVTFGYMGYLMPTWLRKRLTSQSAEVGGNDA